VVPDQEAGVCGEGRVNERIRLRGVWPSPWCFGLPSRASIRGRNTRTRRSRSCILTGWGFTKHCSGFEAGGARLH